MKRKDSDLPSDDSDKSDKKKKSNKRKQKAPKKELTKKALNQEVAEESGAAGEGNIGKFQTFGPEGDEESYEESLPLGERRRRIITPAAPQPESDNRRKSKRKSVTLLKPGAFEEKNDQADAYELQAEEARRIAEIDKRFLKRLGVSETVFQSRVEKGNIPLLFLEPRDINTFETYKDTWDCITLGLKTMPLNPYIFIQESVAEKNFGGYLRHVHSIFNQYRNFKGATKSLHEPQQQEIDNQNSLEQKLSTAGTEHQFFQNQFTTIISSSTQNTKQSKNKPLENAFTYLEKSDTSYTGQQNIQSLKDYYGKKRGHRPEWLHTVANCMGGPISIWNGAAGGYGANTQMATFEHAIAGKPGLGVEIQAYTQPGTRIAEWYVYTIYAYDNNNQVRDKITFHIDGRRQWYNRKQAENDQEDINNFLQQTAAYRNDVPMNDFELPEVLEVRLVNQKVNKVTEEYPDEGPIFAGKNVLQHGNFINYYDPNIHYVKNAAGEEYKRYTGYCNRMLNFYPFHQEGIIKALITRKPDTIIERLKLAQVKEDTIDSLGNNIIHYAAKYNCPELLLHYLDNKALGEQILRGRNKKGYSPLITSILADNPEFVKTYINLFPEEIDLPILDSGNSDISMAGSIPMHFAMQKGNIEIIQLLAKSPKDYLIPNKNGDTPLHLAVQGNAIDVFKNLNLDELLNVKNSNNGFTLLHTAAKYNRVDLMKILIEKKLNPNEVAAFGNNILHIAAMYGSTEVLDYLINEVHMNPNVQNSDLDTPLHIAAQYGQADAVMHLIAYGADMKQENLKKDTPASAAYKSSEMDAFHILSTYDKDLAQFYLNEPRIITPQITMKSSQTTKSQRFALNDRRELQNGWNCGDVALNIQRKDLYDWLMRKSKNEEVRKFLAPEIINAAVMTHILGLFTKPGSTAVDVKVDEIIKQLENDKSLSSEVKKHLRSQLEDLLNQKEFNKEQKMTVYNLGLPPSMHNNLELKNAIEAYLAADAQIAPYVIQINRILLGLKDNEPVPTHQMRGFEELKLYFSKPDPSQNNLFAALAEFQKASAIITPAYEKLYQLCSSQQLYEQYVGDYYNPNNQNWLAFQPSIGGTSVIDAIAKMKNTKITVWEIDEKAPGGFKIVHETATYHNIIGNAEENILYNGHNHYVNLQTNPQYQLQQNLQSSQQLHSNQTPSFSAANLITNPFGSSPIHTAQNVSKTKPQVQQTGQDKDTDSDSDSTPDSDSDNTYTK